MRIGQANKGLITTSKMLKGYSRVMDSLDDLAIDNPIMWSRPSRPLQAGG